jgi:translation initiation factor 4G
MTSPHPPSTSATAQTASSSPPSSATPPAVVRSSYATATKGKPGPPAIVGHGKSNAVSPVNGNPSPPAAPSGTPIVVSSNGPPSSDHSRKPSSVTIQGNAGYLNGGAAGPTARPQMQFGAMTAGASPAVTNSVPNVPNNANLTTPMANSNPARTPSPIPLPSVSGGRPPSGPQAPGGQLNFGSFSGNDNGADANVSC